MPLPPSNGAGPPQYAIQLDTPAFYILIAVLILFLLVLFALRARTASKRALDGFVEATGVDIAFIAFSILLVVYLALRFPDGNREAWTVAEVILGGYWLTFAIPIVTIGNTVHQKTRGAVAWRGSSIGVALVLFVVIFSLYWAYPSLV